MKKIQEKFNTIEDLYDNKCLNKQCKSYNHDLITIKNEFLNSQKVQKLNDYRIKIDTGFACNANCYFCYYKSHLNDPFLELKEIKKQLFWSKNMNFKQVEFSGGESSFHPEWFKMLEIAKDLNLISSTVSNGIKFSDYNFLSKSNALGLNEILFSVHGYKDNHDKMVGHPGAFDKIIKAIENAEKLNIISRINITVNKLNLKIIPKIIDLLLQYNVRQVNFIEINNSHEAFKTARKQHIEIYDSFKFLEPTLDKIINHFRSKNMINFLNIRYLPFCKIHKKYHIYMKNYIHHWFDEFDWNPMFVHRTDFTNEKIKAWKKRDIKYFCTQLKNTRDYWYYKDESCESCEFNGVCDGYKKQ